MMATTSPGFLDRTMGTVDDKVEAKVERGGATSKTGSYCSEV